MGHTKILVSYTRVRCTVWCDVTSNGVTCPYFIGEEGGLAITVTPDRYVATLETSVTQKTTEISSNCWQRLVSSKRINVTHSTNIYECCTPFACKSYKFEKRWHFKGSQIFWYVRVCFFLWGNLKTKVYRSQSAVMEEL